MKISLILLFTSLISFASHASDQMLSEAKMCSNGFQGNINLATIGKEVPLGQAIRKSLLIELESKVEVMHNEPNDGPQIGSVKENYSFWVKEFYRSGSQRALECFLENYLEGDVVKEISEKTFSGYIVETKSKVKAILLVRYYII